MENYKTKNGEDSSQEEGSWRCFQDLFCSDSDQISVEISSRVKH